MQVDVSRLSRMIARIDSFISKPSEIEDKDSVDPFGLIACMRGVHMKRVPFFEPCLILVLSGKKTVYERGSGIKVPAGSLLAVPAPIVLDLTNEPDASTNLYKALVIPFDLQLLEKIRNRDARSAVKANGASGVISYDFDPLVFTAVEHYLDLEGSDNRSLLSHRMMEILLILVEKNRNLLGFIFSSQQWSQRVRSILGEDLSKSWEFGELCSRLAVSETSLRRYLQSEGTGFREILSELRLTYALMQVMQTSAPITQIALDCGYQSLSRFTQNFHERFSLPPTKLREAMATR